MKRDRPPQKLTNSPLALVLCQARFSPLLAMGDYIAKVQDRLRLSGYPMNASTQVQEVLFAPQGAKTAVRQHWEFLTKDRTTSVVVNQGFVVLQTTTYDTFEKFVLAVSDVVDVVASTVGGLLISRLGLRYIDVIRPREGESWRTYVQSGLHGFDSEVFAPDSAVQLHQTVTKTSAGTMIVRLLQNRDGALLPPDFANTALAFPQIQPPRQDELLTVIDIDHFRECEPDDFDRATFEDAAWQLKNGSYAVFADHIATPHALEVWR
jgi:uncharacterized protein (TIGR04255 family)